ncbi:MAG: M48 family metallopeptidase [Clostridiales bacterium]|nr:M48 family metallopeptidase [Clostridiales bacterium]
MRMEYTLVRSKRRSAALEITKDAKLIVRVPLGMPAKDIEEFIYRHRKWIGTHIEAAGIRAERRPEPSAQEQERLKALARAVIPARVEYYSNIMGLRPAGISITGAQKRFGSCSAKNRICFSWRLMQYPGDAIDYVVVHEIAHIAHKNHGADFYALVSSVLPDYRKRIGLLKE